MLLTSHIFLLATFFTKVIVVKMLVIVFFCYIFWTKFSADETFSFACLLCRCFAFAFDPFFLIFFYFAAFLRILETFSSNI